MDKLKAKLNQVEAIIHADDFYTKYSADERLEYLTKRSDIEFKINKENIYVRLTGNDKYYYAHQCAKFTQHILINGFQQYKPKDINSVYFNTHKITIRLMSTGETDIKNFKTKQEMLGFVVGFNTCSREIEDYKIVKEYKHKGCLIKIFKQKPNVVYTDELYDDGDCGYRGDYGYQIFTPDGECIAHDETDQWDDGAAMDNAEWDVQVLYIDEQKLQGEK
tara:strand:- start:155 stop:814 length:660 start_codon:yes stop_codon:yes gene_type:complete